TTYTLQSNLIVPNTVSGTVLDSTGTALYTFLDDGAGVLDLTAVGTPALTVVNGTIDYATGVFTLNWAAEPGGSWDSVNDQIYLVKVTPGTAVSLAADPDIHGIGMHPERIFRIQLLPTATLPTLDYPGTYTIVFGSDISSSIGEKIDTNLNAGLDVQR